MIFFDLDGRKNNGAKGYQNQGRKPKSDELKLVEKLTPYQDTAINVLVSKVEQGDMQAVKLFMEYLHGKPKQIVESDNTHRLEEFDLREVLKFKRNDSTT